MDFIELEHQGLKIIELWFDDVETKKRLGGILPLDNWFTFVKGNSGYFAWMIYDNNQVEAIGHISIEIYPDRSASVSVITNPKLRNKGYGKRMIQNLLERPELLEVDIVKAGIEPDNLASINCFRSVGFLELESDDEEFLTYIYTLNK